jgi:hypothetical protein
LIRLITPAEGSSLRASPSVKFTFAPGSARVLRIVSIDGAWEFDRMFIQNNQLEHRKAGRFLLL